MSVIQPKLLKLTKKYLLQIFDDNFRMIEKINLRSNIFPSPLETYQKWLIVSSSSAGAALNSTHPGLIVLMWQCGPEV